MWRVDLSPHLCNSLSFSIRILIEKYRRPFGPAVLYISEDIQTNTFALTDNVILVLSNAYLQSDWSISLLARRRDVKLKIIRA